MATQRNVRKCAERDYENLCRKPNKYCGMCAGYAHEMPKKDRQEFIRGSLLSVAIGGPRHKRGGQR